MKRKEEVMTKREIFETPQYLDYLDIMDLFKCGRDKALSIIRAIKSVSNIAGIKGKVTISDYEFWYNKFNDSKPVEA